jgi:hypothetical protein
VHLHLAARHPRVIRPSSRPLPLSLSVRSFRSRRPPGAVVPARPSRGGPPHACCRRLPPPRACLYRRLLLVAAASGDLVGGGLYRCRRSLPRTGAGDAGAPPPPLAILRRASSWAPALPCARSWARRRRPALAALAPSLAAQDLGLLQRVVPLVVLRH